MFELTTDALQAYVIGLQWIPGKPSLSLTLKKKIWEGAVKFLAPKKEMLCLIAGLRLGWQILTCLRVVAGPKSPVKRVFSDTGW